MSCFGMVVYGWVWSTICTKKNYNLEMVSGAYFFVLFSTLHDQSVMLLLENVT